MSFAVSYRDFHVLLSPAITGSEQAVPENPFPRPRLAELDCGARCFAEYTLGYLVGRACGGRAAAGGPVAHGRAGASRGMLKPNKI